MSVTATITPAITTDTTLVDNAVNEVPSTTPRTTAAIISPTFTTTETTLGNAVKEAIPSATANSDDETTMIRSGVTAAVLGLLLGGPLLSALLGFTAAYASQKENDRAGRYARSLGDFGASVKERALALDAKYHIAERCAGTADRAWRRATEYDTRYDLLGKTRDVTSSMSSMLVRYICENHLLERGVGVAGRGYEYVASRIGGNGKNKRKESLNTTAATENVSVVTVTSLPISLLPTLLLSTWVLLWVNYIREHRLLQRGAKAVCQGYEYVAKRVGAHDKTETEKNDGSRNKKNILDEMRDVASSLWALLMVCYEYASNRIAQRNDRRNDKKED